MTIPEIMEQLAAMSSATTKNIFLKHGAAEPLFGVKVQDLKTIQKKVKKNHLLAKELYNTGNSDAMYLAGLIADEKAMTKEDLQLWAEQAGWYMISEYTVAWLAAESDYGFELAADWIKSEREQTASAGWAAYANLVSLTPDAELDLDYLTQLLDQVATTIHAAQNRVKYTMNAFVIAVGSYVAPLTEKAKHVARQIGKVSVDMNGTSCKVPDANSYIDKVTQQGTKYKKKVKVRC